MAALLFKVEAHVRCGLTATACTSEECKWNQTKAKRAQPAEVVNIEFSRPKRLKSSNPKQSAPPSSVPAPTLDEFTAFCDKLAVGENRVALLSSVPGHCEEYRCPDEVEVTLPRPLTELFDEKYLELSDEDLEATCLNMFSGLSITEEERLAVEAATRQQSHSVAWMAQRTGRITASNFHAVCHTPVHTPSESLLMKLTYTTPSVDAPALKYGREHEDIARKEYISCMQQSHPEFACVDSGLVIAPNSPHLGASPDGVVSCSCCGKGLLEIKCPHTHRESTVAQLQQDKGLFEERGSLKYGHPYYYQVQGQMNIAGYDYCDFVVWTPQGFTLQRVIRDEVFFSDIKEKLDDFFLRVMLPELLTHKVHTKNTVPSSYEKTTVCICKSKKLKKVIITCSNDTCDTKYFHLRCVGLYRRPRDKWMCPSCRETNVS